MSKINLICPSCQTSLKVEGDTNDFECPICEEKIELLLPEESSPSQITSASIEDEKIVEFESTIPDHQNEIPGKKSNNKILVIAIAAAVMVFLVILISVIISGGENEKNINSQGFNNGPEESEIAEDEQLKLENKAKAERKRKEELAEKKRVEEETKAKAEAERKRKKELVEKKRLEEERKAKAEAEKKRKEERKAKAEAERKKKEAAKKLVLSFIPDNIAKIITNSYSFSEKSIKEGRRLSVNKIKEKVIEKAKSAAEKEFSKKKLFQIRKKASEIYVAFKEGDQVTVQERYGGGYKEVSGGYYGIYGSKVKIGHRYLPLIDIDKKTKEKFFPEVINKRRKEYENNHFEIPKRKCFIKYRNKYEQDIFKKYAYIFNTSISKWEHVDEYIRSTKQALKEKFNSLINVQRMLEKYKIKLSDEEVKYSGFNTELRKAKGQASSAPKIYSLQGYAIAEIENNVYEIAETEYNYTLGYRIPTSEHAYLILKETRFTSKGHFTMDVIILSAIPVKLKQEYGGFTQNWTVYKEATLKDKKIYNEIIYYKGKCNTSQSTILKYKKMIKNLKNREKKYIQDLSKFKAIEMKKQ